MPRKKSDAAPAKPKAKRPGSKRIPIPEKFKGTRVEHGQRGGGCHYGLWHDPDDPDKRYVTPEGAEPPMVHGVKYVPAGRQLKSDEWSIPSIRAKALYQRQELSFDERLDLAGADVDPKCIDAEVILSRAAMGSAVYLHADEPEKLMRILKDHSVALKNLSAVQEASDQSIARSNVEMMLTQIFAALDESTEDVNTKHRFHAKVQRILEDQDR